MNASMLFVAYHYSHVVGNIGRKRFGTFTYVVWVICQNQINTYNCLPSDWIFPLAKHFLAKPSYCMGIPPMHAVLFTLLASFTICMYKNL